MGSTKVKLAGAALVGALVFGIIHGWLLNPQLWFVFDDFAWLYNGRFRDPIAHFTFWPVQGYNDRPMGGVYFQTLLALFGLNARAWHAVGLLFHVVNGFLLFDILRRLSDRGFLHLSRFSLAFAPALFLIWPKSILAVQWPAAVFDLLGAFFIFASIDCFLAAQESHGLRRYVPEVAAMVAFYLGLRTKELAVVVVPVVLTITYLQWKRQRSAREALRQCLPFVLLGAAFVMTILLYILGGEHGLNDSESPYKISLDPLIAARNLCRFLALFFDATHTGFDYAGISLGETAAIAIGVIVAAAFLIRKKSFTGLSGLLFFVVFLGPVLLMKNMQHMLYLYTASSAMSLFLAVLFEAVGTQLRSKAVTAGLAGLSVLLAVYMARLGNVAAIRQNWQALSARDFQSYQDLNAIFSAERPTGGIGVLKPASGYNIFYPYGPGYINNLILNDADIKTSMIEHPSDGDLAKIPYWLELDETTGKVTRRTGPAH